MTKYPLQAVYLGSHSSVGDSMYPVRLGRIYSACWVGNVSTYLELRDIEDTQGDPAWTPSKHFWVINLTKDPGASDEH